MNLENIIQQLQKKRKLFHSEDDLKFELGFLIKKSNPSCEIRLEKPINLEFSTKKGPLETELHRAPIDIVVIIDSIQIPIEIKYKTLALSKEKGRKLASPYMINAEYFDLANQGASDLGRFNFRKDILRIEKVIEDPINNATLGYCLMITNDKDYWNEPKSNSLANNFSLHGKAIRGFDPGWNYPSNMHEKYINIENQWVDKKNNSKKHWTCKGDLFLDLTLAKDYKIKWNEYSNIEQGFNKEVPINSEFKYLLVKID
jgi:hypothetical protein